MTASVPFLSARAVVKRYRTGQLSPVDYTQALLDRIHALDPGLKAVVDVYPDSALRAAQASEARYRAGAALGPLDGLPIAIKDETPVAGRRTTMGSVSRRAHVDDVSAVVVRRMLACGAFVHARTATPEYCCAPFTHSDLWGITRNPWNRAFSPGGSSGGAGVALAAGFTPLADGSDTGGSIRIPAAYCGVVGYKPPYGRVPGVPPHNLDPYRHQGPLARTVDDCALLQDAISGQDPEDPVTVPGRVSVSDTGVDVRGWRVGVSYDCGGYPTSREVQAAVRDAADRFAKLGAHVEEVTPGWTFDQIQRAVHIHGGIRAERFETSATGASDTRTRYLRGVAERAANVRREDFNEGVRLEAEIQRAMATVLTEHRILLCPTMSSTSLVAGEDYVDYGPEVDGVATTKHRDVMPTLLFNICSRNPVMSVPVGMSSQGIPIGMQIAGRPFDDVSVFIAARALEAAAPWPLAIGRPPLGL
ncbi:amidase family protein [Jatrophihabitans cynanchi]|uniref:Amidase family protein n=1 Tax=Jatrophihabitans cynanchi TaxID=2944128 RepID=A0ABY7K2D0_9ACTN|nr:amidase family protein [Jatrophihabitans sp. SB3-54]WAX59003.1 amidase family protein [Jatrophihabitans sp. SB3-54]